MSTISLTLSTVSSRTVVSADQFKTQPQFEEAIHNTLREAKGFHGLMPIIVLANGFQSPFPESVRQVS